MKNLIQKSGIVFMLIILAMTFAHAEMIVEGVSEVENNSSNNIIVSDIVQAAPMNLDAVSITADSSNIYIDSCNYNKATLLVYNPNSASVNVYLTSNREEWVEYSEDSFILDPSESKEVIVFVRPECGTEGRYGLVTNIRLEAFGEKIEKELEQKIVVEKINNLFVSYEPDGFADPCTAINYNVFVKNIGSFVETYKVTSETERVSFQPGTFVLSPDKSKNVTVTFMRDCSEYGQKEIDVEVEAIKNELKADVDLTANIAQNYNFTLEGEENITACRQATTTEAYTVTNNMHFNNSYTIKLKGDKYIQQNGEYFELAPGQTGEVSLDISPAIWSMDNSFEFIVESELGDTELSLPVDVDAIKCYDVDIVKKEHDVCKNDTNANFKIVNDGIYNETINLTLESSRTLQYPESVNINAGETANVTINFNESVDKSFSAKVKASLDGNPQIYDTKKLTFTKYSDKSCYGFSITPTKTNETETYLNFTNVGMRDTDYGVDIYDKNNLTSLDKDYFNLSVGESEIIKLSISNITINNGTNSTAPEKVNAYITGVALESRYWDVVTIKYSILGFNWLLLLIILIILILLILLIWLLVALARKPVKKKTKKVQPRKTVVKKVKEKKQKKKRNLKWLWILFLILLLFLIAAVWLIKFPVDPTHAEEFENYTNTTLANMNESESYKIIPKNSVLKIDLSRSFTDPDGEILNFSGTGSGNISVEIDGDIAKVTPNTNFTGVGTINFSAKDSANATAMSPLINIYVTPKEVFYKEYWREIAVTILLVIFAILVLIKILK